MLAILLTSSELQAKHELTFTYADNPDYKTGLTSIVPDLRNSKAVSLPRIRNHNNSASLPRQQTARLVNSLIRRALHYPLTFLHIAVLFGILRRTNPHILHINNGGYPGAMSCRAAAIAAKFLGIKNVIMVVNNMAEGYNNAGRWLDYPLDRLVAASVDIFVTGSSAARGRLAHILALPAAKTRTIPNGVSLKPPSSSIHATRARLGLPEGCCVVFGVVALLIPRKGHQTLLDAVLLLTQKNQLKAKSFQVLIEGEGPLRTRLQAFVKKNKLCSWVRFVGHETNITDFMSVLDVLVLPSVSNEDFPNVVLEAMALAKPVIASRISGTPEQVVDGETGILFEPGNSNELSQCLSYMINSPATRKTMGDKAEQRFRSHFTPHAAVRRYQDLYEETKGTER